MALLLYTLQGIIRIQMQIGTFQSTYFSTGFTKEAEVCYRKGSWFFNLVLGLLDSSI